MNPLCERSSKFHAKLIVVGVWISALIAAVPMLFFYRFDLVYDPIDGGQKPFCHIVQGGPVGSVNVTDYDDYSEYNASMEDYYDYDLLESSGLQPPASFQTYQVALSAIQYFIPLCIISFAYARMGVKLWLTRTPGAAQQKRDEMILVNKKKVNREYFMQICSETAKFLSLYSRENFPLTIHEKGEFFCTTGKVINRKRTFVADFFLNGPKRLRRLLIESISVI